MSSCDDFEARIADLPDLRDDARFDLERHAETCRSCRAKLVEYRALMEALRSLEGPRHLDGERLTRFAIHRAAPTEPDYDQTRLSVAEIEEIEGHVHECPSCRLAVDSIIEQYREIDSFFAEAGIPPVAIIKPSLRVSARSEIERAWSLLVSIPSYRTAGVALGCLLLVLFWMGPWLRDPYHQLAFVEPTETSFQTRDGSSALNALASVPLTHDSMINLNKPGKINGARQIVRIGPAFHGFAAFDLTTLPPGVTGEDVEKATLRIWVNKLRRDGSLRLHTVLDPWDEATLNGNLMPLVAPDPLATTLITASDQKNFVTIDVTSAVEGWLDGTPNHGLVLMANDADVTIDSKENAGTSHAMELDIVLAGLPRGISLMNERRYSEALTFIEPYIASEPDAPLLDYAHYLAGFAWVSEAKTEVFGRVLDYSEARLDRAIEHLQMATESSRNDRIREDAFWLLGKAYLMKKDPDHALEAFREVERLDGRRSADARQLIQAVQKLEGG